MTRIPETARHPAFGQRITTLPSFTLESGVTLKRLPVAYNFYGRLSESGDNAIVVCHALSGSSSIGSWWAPLLGGTGSGRALDMSKYFIVCLNTLGSPYGTASPVTYKDGVSSKGSYRREFPRTTIRDDVRLFKQVLDSLGVKQIVSVIGGSMGGMLVLEFAYFGPDYVRSIVPIATAASHSAWGISWGEIQRRCIYNDPKFDNGFYSPEDPPIHGLAMARMTALMTYRSPQSFQRRFGRKTQPMPVSDGKNTRPTLSVHSYLEYQGDKFNDRFDANCYIALTHKLDSHDVSRNRTPSRLPHELAIREALGLIVQPTLVLGIESDVLFTYSEQEELHDGIPNSTFIGISSEDGHDGFLLEMAQVNQHIVDFLIRVTASGAVNGTGALAADRETSTNGFK